MYLSKGQKGTLAADNKTAVCAWVCSSFPRVRARVRGCVCVTPGDRCQPVYVRGVEAAPAGQVGRHACASECMCATGGGVRFVVLGFEQPYEARRLHLSGCADMRVNVFAYVGICARTCLLPFAHARRAEPP